MFQFERIFLCYYTAQAVKIFTILCGSDRLMGYFAPSKLTKCAEHIQIT